LDALFSHKTWQVLVKGSGHSKFKNVLTDVVVEYKAHGSNSVGEGVVDGVMNQAQEHLNVVRNHAWKGIPWKDAQQQMTDKTFVRAAAARLQRWKQSGKSSAEPVYTPPQ